MHMYDEILEQPQILSECREVNAKVIERVAENIKKKKPGCIIIAARGTSDHAAIYARYCFEIMLGIPVSLAAPSVVTLYNGKMDYRDTVVIGITQSGMAEDVRLLIKDAKEQGALTIACTNALSSPVANEAEFHLYCNAGKEQSVAATKTFMAQLYLMAQLVAHLAEDEKLMQALDGLSDGVQTLLKGADKIAAKMKDYTNIDRCFILGRGFAYPIVREAALKLQETTYTLSYAYAISDFWHGPLAMVAKGTPVFLYSSGGAVLQDEIAIMEKLKEIGADIMAITAEKTIADMANRSVMIPEAEPAVLPFYHLVVAQLFAYGLTQAKGLNPDSPRYLNKVTITK
jgi:glucosamine--fructose-6-phosphate aminotransferase (isomerizing)